MKPRPQRLLDARPFTPPAVKVFDAQVYYLAVKRAWDWEVVRLQGRVLSMASSQYQIPDIQKPVTRHLVTVIRDEEPVSYRMSVARHNPRKGSKNYHERIQKKWAKKATSQLFRAQETVVFSLSPLQLKIVKSVISKQQKL